MTRPAGDGERTESEAQAVCIIDGPAEAPPIVFVHGTRLARSSWRPVMRRLDGEFRVLACDLPGHGRREAETFSIEGAADAIAGVIEDLAGGRAVVVGLSLGGYVGMELAARRPELVAGLVLAGASQEPVGRWTWPYRTLAVALERAPVGVIDGVSRRFFRARFRAEIAGAVLADRHSPRGGAVALRALVGQRFRPRLAAYPGPVLILNGQLDPLFRAGERAFLEACRDGRLVVLPKATHLSNLDRPAAFAAAVRGFARDVFARPSHPGASGSAGDPV